MKWRILGLSAVGAMAAVASSGRSASARSLAQPTLTHMLHLHAAGSPPVSEPMTSAMMILGLFLMTVGAALMHNPAQSDHGRLALARA